MSKREAWENWLIKGCMFRDEAHFTQECRQAAVDMGLLFYHTHNSQRSDSGFPDVVVTGPKGTIFRELKMPANRPTPTQALWIETLQSGGLDALVIYPDDWDEYLRDLMALL